MDTPKFHSRNQRSHGKRGSSNERKFEESPHSGGFDPTGNVELLHTATDVNGIFEVIVLAFDYGKAKGYRAAKAEVERG